MSEKIIQINNSLNNNSLSKKVNIDDEFNSSFESDISIEYVNKNEEEEEEEISEQMKKISKSISTILIELIELTKNQKYQNQNDIFDTNSIPNMTLYDYINRIIFYTNCEENTLISALIYIDRIAKIKKISFYNVYKLIFTSILMSLKYNEDEIYKNDYYSQIAGVSIYELKKMEYEFYILVNFNLYINESNFMKYKYALEQIND
jgi:hypothetical protein